MAQRNDGMSWKILFDIQDASPGAIREAKIQSRFFKRLTDKPNVWQRDLVRVRDGVEIEWTEEIHLSPTKSELIRFITTEPVEFERMVKLLSDKEDKDDFGMNGGGEGFTVLEPKTLASGRIVSRYSGKNRMVEILSNRQGNIEEWIFQITKTAVPFIPQDKTAPVISVVAPANAQLKSISQGVLEKNIIKIKVTDESGIKSVIFDGRPIALKADGTYSQQMILGPNVDKKLVTVIATDNRGNQGSLEFNILRPKVREPVPGPIMDLVEIGKGRYYALIVSVQNYQYGIPVLYNPHKDADSLAKVLTSRYRFNSKDVTVLKDPRTVDLGEALEKLQDNLGETDNLLIFFSGHGEWDKKIEQGYWLLKDAEVRNKATWMSNSTIRDYIKGIKSRHTLLVTDACFSGSIFRGSPNTVAEMLYKNPSRRAITSGNLEKVPDKSVFMHYFLTNLKRNNKEYLPAGEFFQSFYEAVITNSVQNPQLPQYNPISDCGHEGGDFIFALK